MPSSHRGVSHDRKIPHQLSRSQPPLDVEERSARARSRGREVGESLFVEDHKGDRQNLTYGSLDRHAIPRYRLAGHGGLLGLGPNYRIISRSESHLDVENVEIDSTRRSRKQSLLWNLPNDDQEVLNVQSGVSNVPDLHKDFLRLDHDHPRKRRRILPGLEHPSLEGDESDESDSDIQGRASSENAFEDFKRNPVHQRHIELLRATEARPEDVSAWLALIEYQPVFFSSAHDSHSSGPSSSRGIVDLKISLYEQALSRVKAREDRIVLIVGLMEQGKMVWDADKQASKWRTFLDDDATFDLWRLYLNFVQTNHVKFSFEDCLNTYKQWLHETENACADRTKDTSYIYILLRLTLLLWQSGFTERAVGIWQALLEFNYFRPPNLPCAELVPSFQEFWDSEVARIGEEGSAGWRSNASAEIEPKSDKIFHVQDMDFDAWASAENGLEKTAGMPARALDEVDQDDPYRVLLFPDIRDFLFSPTTEEGSWLLQDAFLLFLGLPPLSSLPESRVWERDPFIYSQSPAYSISLLSAGLVDYNFPMRMRFQEVFLESRQLNSGTHNIPFSLPERVIASYFGFARRTICQLAGLAFDGELREAHMEYAIALEAGFDLKSARKQTRSFLKHRADSLRLYNAYALLECHLENFESAERVWSTALSMRYSLSQEIQIDSFLLWRDWAYSYMCRRQFRHARTLLGMITDPQVDISRLQQEIEANTKPSAALQIKVEQYIKTHIEGSRSLSRAERLPALVDILAFHKYLNADLSLEIALETYSASLKSLAGLSTISSAVLEAIHEHRARFIYSHSVTFGRSFKPSELGLVLKGSAEMFPDNLNLLLLHHYFLQKAGLFDRLRQVNPEAEGPRHNQIKASVIPCVFDLMVELNRPSYAGSTDHCIRSAFKRATQLGSPGHDSLEIWKSYVLWETSLLKFHDYSGPQMKKSTQHKERAPYHAAMATQSFYASLRACPWSKELCMLGFTEPVLRNAIGDEKLRQVYQNMLDRGMRLHIDISDTFL
ncbi:uncharacterized protein Z519_10932 [Cladophialophora bantiana CBS 173.52]|uniref:DUF1740-domain-containing protein n=1 Tax=Cladophialophora bantiana (strain ATCC 10958 / CBS 173.52 / CDC B-1940 / NIH 8579) TaxID=1442370 RepID=A0A0D2H4Y6_CLAB1|nr:uncharacterized protein Z519_10932 [Cladophialophora bantiana CBS 173.52]KIW88363.1 hypothetical protein Z519_10932 [Cladophialophora bantiana CBS 173.52]